MENFYIPKHEHIIKPSGHLTLVLGDKDFNPRDVQRVKNLITDAAKTSMASALRGVTSNSQGIITYCALGTDGTAPADADTTLGSELDRKLVSVRSSASNVATFQTYFTTSEAVGTLLEAGLFGDSATDTADTGTLFAHTAINRTKTANDTLTLYWDITIG